MLKHLISKEDIADLKKAIILLIIVSIVAVFASVFSVYSNSSSSSTSVSNTQAQFTQGFVIGYVLAKNKH